MAGSKKSLRWLNHYTSFLSFTVLVLIFVGALVKSHEAGLTVPDWPTTYGQNMFLYPYELWIGGIFFEHGHRLLASAIGLFTVILSFWLWISPVSSTLRFAGILAVVTVLVQGLLGGLTVIYLLPDAISIAHGMLAQTFLLLILFIRFHLRAELYKTHSASIPHRGTLTTDMFWLGVGALGLLYLQLFLGAATRHAEAGLAIPDFPLMGGQIIPQFDVPMFAVINEWRQARYLPPVSSWQVLLHLLHRLGALVVGCYFAFFAFRLIPLAGPESHLRKTALFAGTLANSDPFGNSNCSFRARALADELPCCLWSRFTRCNLCSHPLHRLYNWSYSTHN
jgi:heme a synthase